MPVVSHDEESKVALHFDYCDLRNEMVPLGDTGGIT